MCVHCTRGGRLRRSADPTRRAARALTMPVPRALSIDAGPALTPPPFLKNTASCARPHARWPAAAMN
eukprot:5258510-Pyramimonas_sp.AAC.1